MHMEYVIRAAWHACLEPVFESISEPSPPFIPEHFNKFGRAENRES